MRTERSIEHGETKVQASALRGQADHRLPIVATMAEESNLRLQKWLKHGCNAFDLKRPMSAPMSFWSENDVLEYLFKYELDYAECYGKIIPKLDKYHRLYRSYYRL